MRFKAIKQLLYLTFTFYITINQLDGAITSAQFLNQRFKMMAVLQYHKKIGKMRRVMQLKKIVLGSTSEKKILKAMLFIIVADCHL